jgi:hypothetical protein
MLEKAIQSYALSLSLSCSFSSPCLLLTHTLSVSCASLLLTYRCAECRPPWRRSLSYLTSKVPLCLLRHSCGSLTALTAGYTMANNDLPLCREAISILQNYYPERLGPSLSVCGCMYVVSVYLCCIDGCWTYLYMRVLTRRRTSVPARSTLHLPRSVGHHQAPPARGHPQ